MASTQTSVGVLSESWVGATDTVEMRFSAMLAVQSTMLEFSTHSDTVMFRSSTIRVTLTTTSVRLEPSGSLDRSLACNSSQQTDTQIYP